MRSRDVTRTPNALRGSLLTACCSVAVLAGCGGSGSSSTPAASQSRSQAPPTVSTTSSSKTHAGKSPTKKPAAPAQAPASSEHVAKLTIAVSVTDLSSGRSLPARHTCDGGDVSLPLRWSHVPHGTAELALFVVSFQPVRGRLFLDWAVAGLHPALRGIPAGRLPPGAAVGRNGFGRDGYSICPAKGTSESYAVRVLALPHTIAARPGFDALTFYRRAERSAKVAGLTGVTYKRR